MRMNVSVIGVSMRDDYPLVGMLSMRSRYMLIEWLRRHDHDVRIDRTHCIVSE
jgi:hypothetical protein